MNITINIDCKGSGSRKTLRERWHAWQANHSAVAHLVVILEAAAFGAVADYVMSGGDITLAGLKLTVTAAVTAALRNYFKDNVKTIRERLDAQKDETK